jgi:hypothetical protein
MSFLAPIDGQREEIVKVFEEHRKDSKPEKIAKLFQATHSIDPAVAENSKILDEDSKAFKVIHHLIPPHEFVVNGHSPQKSRNSGFLSQCIHFFEQVAKNLGQTGQPVNFR